MMNTPPMKSSLLPVECAVIAIFSVLIVFNDYKWGDVRILECALVALCAFEALKLIRTRQPPAALSVYFTAVIVALFGISMLSINQAYYLDFTKFGPLKKPLPIVISRLVQLAGCWGFVVYFTRSFRERVRVFDALTLIVTIVAVLAAIMEISFALHVMGVLNSPFAYESGGARMRGGEVEGGPFGLMLAGMLGLLIFLWQSGRRHIWQSFPLLLGIVLSRSKAGMFALVIVAALLILNGYLVPGSRKKIAVLSGGAALAFAMIYFFAWDDTNYIRNFGNAEERVKTNLAAEQEKDDYNSLVTGRVAAWHIAPRMVAANPAFGVGLGHYSLVRNDPRYRGPFPEVQVWDLTGLGIGTLLVEVGLVGTILFCGIFALLFVQLRRKSETRAYAWLAVVPLVFLIFGVQYYFLYPWMFVAVGRALSESPCATSPSTCAC